MNKPGAGLQRFTPLIILLLVGALVLVSWLYVVEKARHFSSAAELAASGDGRVYRWRMATTWPKHFPGLGVAAERFAQDVERMSGGRIQIRVYGAGELVPAMGVFDAVSLGTVEMGHATAYYWKGKIPAAPFFSSIPFGMTAQEMNAWLHYGGGMELWREAYAPFNLVPLAVGNTGVQMAGWFNKEIKSLADLKGMKMRIPGIGGEVWSRAGGTSINLPGGELFTSLQTGVVDATEWVAPYNDMALGLHEVARYYYYPGWQEPGPSLELIINRKVFEGLPDDLRAIIETAARSANADVQDEYVTRNGLSLSTMLKNHPGVSVRPLPDDVLRALHKASREVIGELAAADPLAARVYRSWADFYASIREYQQISERAYINAREQNRPENSH